MRFYLIERNLFISLAMNSGAQLIWFSWLLGFNCLTFSAILASNWSAMVVLLVLGLACIAGSWLFLPRARKIHQDRIAAGSQVLFPKGVELDHRR